jgi:5-methylcytosine-specific restriction endonuclease McrA
MGHDASREPGWAAIRIRVLTEEGWTCWICRGDADTVDHLLPQAQGGAHDRANLRACCQSCNARRGGQISSTARPAERRCRSRGRRDGISRVGFFPGSFSTL